MLSRSKIESVRGSDPLDPLFGYVPDLKSTRMQYILELHRRRQRTIHTFLLLDIDSGCSNRTFDRAVCQHLFHSKSFLLTYILNLYPLAYWSRIWMAKFEPLI
jgi:hypothetical protein